MDPDAGRFVEEERVREWMKKLELGEVVEIKGEKLEVLEIKDRTVTLKLLSMEDRLRKAMDLEPKAYHGLNREEKRALDRKRRR